MKKSFLIFFITFVLQILYCGISYSQGNVFNICAPGLFQKNAPQADKLSFKIKSDSGDGIFEIVCVDSSPLRVGFRFIMDTPLAYQQQFPIDNKFPGAKKKRYIHRGQCFAGYAVDHTNRYPMSEWSCTYAFNEKTKKLNVTVDMLLSSNYDFGRIQIDKICPADIIGNFFYDLWCAKEMGLSVLFPNGLHLNQNFDIASFWINVKSQHIQYLPDNSI
ncbi:hypothetical protein C4J81_13300 [Deltaproteobacteria bacterium Smac51]|nr:hypothetical protein C4J81_13300 [Deltaproteobacteria bacterium Smac51]